MTKITFIDLPHEICAAARAAAAEAAAKTAAATKISKQEEKAIVKPNNHLPSRLWADQNQTKKLSDNWAQKVL